MPLKPSEISVETTVLSARYAVDASRLSSRILDFESWLTSLRGRVPVEIIFDTPTEARRLTLERRSVWGLWLWRPIYPEGLSPAEDELYENEWAGRKLSDCSIDEKILAIPQFRELVELLHSEQRQRIDKLKVAGDDLNALISELGIDESKEGE